MINSTLKKRSLVDWMYPQPYWCQAALLSISKLCVSGNKDLNLPDHSLGIRKDARIRWVLNDKVGLQWVFRSWKLCTVISLLSMKPLWNVIHCRKKYQILNNMMSALNYIRLSWIMFAHCSVLSDLITFVSLFSQCHGYTISAMA